MVFFCKFKHQEIDRGKVFNHCFKKHCKSVGLFRNLSQAQGYVERIKRDQKRYQAYD